MRLSLLSFALSLLFIGCGETYSEKHKENFNSQIEEYLLSQELEFNKTESGLYYHIFEQEKDTIKSSQLLMNDEVLFYYTGSLIDGEVFQEIDEKDALQFKVKELIYGWQEALQLISPMGKIKIIIPPHLGYADNETGLVPANSILIFDLTLKKLI